MVSSSSFFLHLRKICNKIRSKCSRSRSSERNITFTIAEKGRKPTLPQKETTSKQASYGDASEKIAERIGELEVFKQQQEATTVINEAKNIRLATFNVALFALAPAVPRHQVGISRLTYSEQKFAVGIPSETDCSSSYTSTLKISNRMTSSPPPMTVKVKSMQSPPPSVHKTIFHATHNLEANTSASNVPGKHTLRPSSKSPVSPLSSWQASTSCTEISAYLQGNRANTRTIYDVLREADADLVALQEVKADESKGMKPLSELAEALGMQYAFAESWAPEFGNAVLSRWPIKSWHVKKLADDSDFRNMIRVVVDVPSMGELHFCCTHLDHLDESFRWKQVTSLIKSLKRHPHILAGDLNALNLSDYSRDRWNEIAKFRENCGKMPPRGEVMTMLKEKGYIDSAEFAGDSEIVVILPSGQEVQGTCKCGTRIDYILASPSLPYKFVPGSYTVVSSKGTSDHHLVIVDIQHIGSSSMSS